MTKFYETSREVSEGFVTLLLTFNPLAPLGLWAGVSLNLRYPPPYPLSQWWMKIESCISKSQYIRAFKNKTLQLGNLSELSLSQLINDGVEFPPSNNK